MENTEIHELNKKVDAIKVAMSQQSSEIKEIRDAILGTEYSNEKGIITDMDDFDKRLKTLEEKWNNAKWLMIGIGVAGGITISNLASILGGVIK